MICANCGRDVSAGAAACLSCGAPVATLPAVAVVPPAATDGTVFCRSCGRQIGPKAVVCLGCGVATAQPNTDPLAKSKLAAGLLGIFLGGLGIHRFYLGYVGIGVAQIAVTLVTCGAGHLWGLIEGILILAGSSITTDATGRPLKD